MVVSSFQILHYFFLDDMLKSKDRNRNLVLSIISVAKCVNVYYRSLNQEHINNSDTYEYVCSVVCTVVIVVSAVGLVRLQVTFGNIK